MKIKLSTIKKKPTLSKCFSDLLKDNYYRGFSNQNTYHDMTLSGKNAHDLI